MAGDPSNQWERTYRASVEREHQAALRAEELHQRAMATLSPPERRKRRRVYLAILFLMAPLLVLGIVVDGLASHDVVSGEAVPGTVVLDREVRVCVGRPPCTMTWQGRFTSDDGTIDRVVEFAENVPPDQAVSGAVVEARWSSVRPEAVYLAKSQAFRDWAVTTAFLLVASMAVAFGVLIVWRRRSRLRRQIAAEEAGQLPGAGGSDTDDLLS